jgi:hypothetical protein
MSEQAAAELVHWFDFLNTSCLPSAVIDSGNEANCRRLSCSGQRPYRHATKNKAAMKQLRYL